MNGFLKTCILKVRLKKWSKRSKGLSDTIKMKELKASKMKTRFSRGERG